jgi:hypothetical protein
MADVMEGTPQRDITAHALDELRSLAVSEDGRHEGRPLRKTDHLFHIS